MHALFLHNSLSRRKERFEPLEPQHVRMYVCGPTVYDLAHIGNARTMVVFDVLARLLRVLYPRVTYVRNITDVDDKINARAKESGEPIASITARTTADFHADMAALGVLPPDEEPRATQHIAEMIEIIQRLIAGGNAYAAEGHVLFSVASFKAYGHLSGRSPDELLAGARIDVAPYKRDPGDFVLWKPSTPDLPGWDSPWGRGRPGWHIECSAMAWRYLGETFDIHGGGTDLIFPHHENEVGAECLRVSRQPFRALLGAQRHAEDERREDVEEPRQLLHHPRGAREGAGRGDAALADPHALPLDRGFLRRGAGGGEARTRSVLPRAGALSRHSRVSMCRHRSWRRCAMT